MEQNSNGVKREGSECNLASTLIELSDSKILQFLSGELEPNEAEYVNAALQHPWYQDAIEGLNMIKEEEKLNSIKETFAFIDKLLE